MTEYIEREAISEEIRKFYYKNPPNFSYVEGFDRGLDRAQRAILDAPAADVAQVRHGRWGLTTHSFYRDTFDESCELCVYIVANCSECSENHPNSYQVFSKTLYAPDDTDDDFRFDKKRKRKRLYWSSEIKSMSFPTTVQTAAPRWTDVTGMALWHEQEQMQID